MQIKVQKYGGACLDGVSAIEHVARLIQAQIANGYQIVAVVSARKGQTDRLLAEAQLLDDVPDPQYQDLLITTGEQQSVALLGIALNKLGISAATLIGAHIGIHLDAHPTHPRIESLDTHWITSALKSHSAVIVAGFQAIDSSKRLTTLGRGGSDLTALSIAIALQADRCEIFTDVAGVYTANPNRIPNAQLIQTLTHQQLLQMADAGARVMQPRSVAMAYKYSYPFSIHTGMHAPHITSGTQISSNTKTHECPSETIALVSKELLAWNLIVDLTLNNPIAKLIETCASIPYFELSSAHTSRMHTHQILYFETLYSAQPIVEGALKTSKHFCNCIPTTPQSMELISIIGISMGSNFRAYAACISLMHTHMIAINGLECLDSMIRFRVQSHQATQALNLLHAHFYKINV